MSKDYLVDLSLRETESAIKIVKDFFQAKLAGALNLSRVSAPLFVYKESGLNDDLNGVERPVQFDVMDLGRDVQIVHSLAKWKRMALHRYGFEVGEGLYTDMDAIRRDEVMDHLHSIYVDQWDWEKIITKEERTEATLKEIVTSIYSTFKSLEEKVHDCYPDIKPILPEEITFISAQELEDMYPEMTSKEREDAICREKKAVFLIGIGDKLKSGERHDGRAPDYDDWSLNGDIIFYNPVLDSAFEMSSMGIRVSEEVLEEQLKKADAEDRKSLDFHKKLLAGELPYTVGGGIGQSRICMFFLRKRHIGEVQASVWTKEIHEACEKEGIMLL
ncbi:aspartate--ammonia ligase [Acidaminobacter sp. JC074]|uniref:aspartate--ammonia ligase n=1 Tax=Acidaminobacter sp. JC074 TaxID=2530199 RepID=UPI001F0FC7D5|nr:aspartate--ammonia ligase [Acidaminobacter sp. JC074]MCH4889889.1 aspartate--ammonia ligase [Acidaminobacter sp. JC074]